MKHVNYLQNQRRSHKMNKLLRIAALALLFLSSILVSNIPSTYASNMSSSSSLHHVSPPSTHPAPTHQPKLHKRPGPKSDGGSLLWRYQTGGSVGNSSPTLVNGVIYIGSYDGYVYALNASDGTRRWSYKTGGAALFTPAVVNGVVYVGSYDPGNSVYALAASNGSFLWSYPTGGFIESSPTVVNGVVYIGSNDNYVYALDANNKGALLWRYLTGNHVTSSPTVVNGVVYVGSYDDYVYALNANNKGALLWRFQTGGFVYGSSPTVVNGVLYIGSQDDYVYALNASDGTLLWRYQTGYYVESSPTVVNGVLFIGSEDDYVYALDANNKGALLWRYLTGSYVDSSPTVVNGVLYIGSADGNVYALTASTGVLIWKYQTGSIGWSSPTVVNGVLYIGSADNYVYALNAGSPTPTPTPTLTPTPTPPPDPVAHFTWKMSPRFGRVQSGPGKGLPSYPSDIYRDTYTVKFDACGSTGDPVIFTWTYIGGSKISGDCSTFATDLTLGTQPVSLTVTDKSGHISTPDQQMLNVQDFLIVSLGDSISSAEGNPDVAGQCDQPPHIERNFDLTTECNPSPVWIKQYSNGPHENPQCHRSTWAGPAQAALSLDQQTKYPHTSVTFLHLACSGATIMEGLMGPYKGIDDNHGSWQKLAPQLQEANILTRGRPIDALLLTIGANDIGFGDIVRKCILWGIFFPFNDCGTYNKEFQLQTEFEIKLKELSKNLDTLGGCITTGGSCSNKSFYLGVSANHVFLANYLDPARQADGISYCDAGFGNGISGAAWKWAENNILVPLNTLLYEKAIKFGWTFVSDFNALDGSNSFLHHGYCAQQTWIRPYLDDPNNTPPSDGVTDPRRGTYSLQGNEKGMMHPNYWGQQRYAESYINSLEHVLPFN